MQSYATTPPVQHVDLYRIGAPDELDELGLFATRRWSPWWNGRNEPDALPDGAVTVRLELDGEGRKASISGPPEALARIRRSLDARAFLERSGAATPRGRGLPATRRPAVTSRSRRAMRRPGCWSTRRRWCSGPPVKDGRAYAEIAHTARSAGAFVAIAGLLRARGLSVPEVLAPTSTAASC